MKKSEIFKEVMNVVCDFTEIPKENIVSKNRNADVVAARCLVVVYCKSFGLSNTYIQNALSLKSHASICNYIRMYDDMKKTDRSFRHIDVSVGHELDNMSLLSCW